MVSGMNVSRGSKCIFMTVLLLSSAVIWLVMIMLPTRPTSVPPADKEHSSKSRPSFHQRSTYYWNNSESSTSLLHKISNISRDKSSHKLSTMAPINSPHHGRLNLSIRRKGEMTVVSGCNIPSGGFKSWQTGVVTRLIPKIHANCTLLFKGDVYEASRIQYLSHFWPHEEHSLTFNKWVRDCDCADYREELEENVYITREERLFPLAFTFVIHDEPFQVFRLLKVIYRPHNVYCIHYDKRSSQEMKLLFNKLAMCFDNIIIPSNITRVHWGEHSLMEAQMNCFKDLLKNRHKYPWRYLITLCGKELPLRTNREIVHLLRGLNGTSAVRAHQVPISNLQRFHMTWKGNVPIGRADSIPYHLPIYKSIIYFALTPEFVNYLLNDKVAIALYEFLKDSLIPEEHFYSTLFMIPGKLFSWTRSI